jgi:Recombination endonuclease VII
MKLRNLENKIFGQLRVLKRDTTKGNGPYWICECDCGNISSVRTYSLINGHSKSCGCLRKLTRALSEEEKHKRQTQPRACKNCNQVLLPEQFPHIFCHVCRQCEANRKCKYEYRKKKYGLSEEQFLSLCAKHNQRCAICNVPFTNSRHRHIDHNHKTNKVRGILCRSCNHMLGNAHDDPQILKKAAAYLQKSEENS